MVGNENVDKFLYSIGMHPDWTDISKTAEAFLDEMRRGLWGEKSSLRMIPTYIGTGGRPFGGVPVVAVDAGGTNLRIGLVTFYNGRAEISRFEQFPMPGSRGEISSDEFFSILAEKILPLLDESETLGFCFSYPTKVFPNRDGQILCLTKEVKIRNIENALIGESLIEELRSRGLAKPLKFTLLNDTAASLMGGVATLNLSDCSGLAGLILGTGFNVCYVEEGANIIKLENAHDMIINCECGNFSKAVRGVSDIMTDEASEIPGEFLLEKMFSGAYHGRLVTNTAILAARSGLLSKAFLKPNPPFTTLELDEFLRDRDGRSRITAMCTGNDADIMKGIIDRSFERLARLVCAVIAALCVHTDGGTCMRKPFCVIAEGSIFHNSLLFRAKLDKYIDSFIKAEISRNVVIRRAENATMVGAALSALLN